ncbi:MAG: ABC transporter ATP-binding protein [Abditibacteriales bacterium]|nr:ABC transporter ATP-binding protein [Abditibacteriales bacterium]
MLRTENLTKKFGSLVAVNNLDLTLEQGDVFGFIGPNGAGKTTTINMLAGLVPPTSGRAFIGDVDVTRQPDQVKRLIGYMPEHFGVYEDVTVWEYLNFFAHAFGIHGRARQRVIDDVLALVDLEHKRHALVETLSRGMKQRLCLAQALVHDPLVLLLDEPASGLDPRARVEMRALLHELQAMGKTILVSSHILRELSDFCNKIGIIERGTLLISGSVQEVLAQVVPHRTLRIRVLDGVEEAERIVTAHGKVMGLESENGYLRVTFDGTDEEVAQLLETLVTHRVRVVAFEEESADLEEAFLRLTQGEVG